MLDKHKMAKHFELTIADAQLRLRPQRREEIAQEAALDGLYAVRTSLPEDALDDAAAVAPTNRLAQVERAFRCLKTVDLHVRPIYHWLEDRVRAHVFLCMLAYYVEWHMRARLAPMLYDDDDKAAAEALRASPVAKAQRSPSALAKSATGRTADGAPGPQLPEPARRSRDPGAQHHRHRHRAQTPLDHPDPPNTHPAKGLRPPRNPHRLYPVAATPKTARRERDQWLTLRERKKLRLVARVLETCGHF